MVGVPRSRGCGICVRRRVKCDETRPSCVKCSTYGVSCPGYERSFKFVDRVHRRPKRLTAGDGSTEAEAKIVSTIPKLAALKVLNSSSNQELNGTMVTTIRSPNSYQAQYLSAWLGDLSRSSSPSPDEVTISRLFNFIPARLGRSTALDLAVRCLTENHFGVTVCNDDIIHHGWFTYGQAIRSLQRAVYDPVEAVKSETICATMILCIYELFACTRADSWMKHANGVSKMILLRGPKSFENDFDRAMLMAFKGMIIMEALFSGKACFLDLEEWRSIALQPINDSFVAQLYDKTQELGKSIAACPWLVSEAYAIRELPPSDASFLFRVMALSQRAFEIYGPLKQWFEGFTTFLPPPKEVPSTTKDDLYPTIYDYSNSSTATIFCGYYAMIMILQKILVDCHHPAGDDREITLMVDNVCKSIEYLAGTGLLGPYRVGFSMRVAFELGTITKKLWIKKWLVQFGKFYKACSPENYPPIEVEDNETPTPQ